MLLGVPMALVLARTSFRGQGLVRSLVLLPLVLPPVVGGIALLYTFGRRGLLGEHARRARHPDRVLHDRAVVLAQTFVSLPFLVVSLEGALRTAGARYEAVAATLGAAADDGLPPGHAAAGAARAGRPARCSRSPGRSASSARRSPSPAASQGVTRTLPLEIYLQRETDPDAAVALSLVLVVGRGRW